MKAKNLLINILLLLIFCFTIQAQNLITINKTITKDTIIVIPAKLDLASKSIFATGQVEFFSTTGYLRILLTDDNDFNLLIYESFPLVAEDGKDDFKNAGIESSNISSFFTYTKIQIKIKEAKVNNLSLDIYGTEKSILFQQNTTYDKISKINNNLRKRNALWIAGETNISKLSYEEKKNIFGANLPDLQGYEYYAGGIFEFQDNNTDSLSQKMFMNSSNSVVDNFVPEFDWRNRHGANNPTSPYYNSNGN